MLKITVHVRENMTKLILEGRLGGPWVNELERCSRAAHRDAHELFVDLTDVRFIDQEGEALLIRLWRHGVTVHSSAGLSKSIIEDITRVERVPRNS